MVLLVQNLMEYAKLRLGKRGEGVRPQEGPEPNISRELSPPKLSKPLVTEFPKGREESVLLQVFFCLPKRILQDIPTHRNFQEFP